MYLPDANSVYWICTQFKEFKLKKESSNYTMMKSISIKWTSQDQDTNGYFIAARLSESQNYKLYTGMRTLKFLNE